EDSVDASEENTHKEVKAVEKIVLSDENINEIKKYSSFVQTKKKQKKYREMIEYINHIMQIDPDFDYAKNILLFWRGNGYEELGIKDSAKVDYERFSELKPDYSQVLVQLDYIYVTEGNIEKAIEIAKKMIELDSKDKTLLKKIGKYYYQLAENLKEEDPNDPEIEENASCAIDCFEEYIESCPEDEEINNLLTFLISKFLDQQALKVKLECNLKMNPDDLKTIERLSMIYYDEGNGSKAADLLEKLLEQQPNNLKAIKRLIKINKTNIEKSIFYNQRAMKLDDANEIYNINLAKLYVEKKRFADARSECIKARTKNSKNMNIFKAWASIYTESIGACEVNIEYQDKLVFVISYGLYETANDTRRLHAMKESGQVPCKSDFFTNKNTRLPTRECYKWINTEWDEVKYIETFLKAL
ncbi:MAG: tetratricopeptide repeat protein, partial [Candidatus Delongbacteria bacterium]|nr:tetratricopeptide repeat protein [Candidatus Delongbacteria bacterium]